MIAQKFVLTAVMLVAVSVCHGQFLLLSKSTPPRYVTEPNSILPLWSMRQARKDVTGGFPTDFKPNARYRLLQDVVVERGGTHSRVTPYWVKEWHARDVDEVRQALADPKARKEYEIAALREATGNLVLTDSQRRACLASQAARIWKRKESRVIVDAGTTVRFGQLWLEGNNVMGVSVHAYVEVLDPPLQGKWLGVFFLTQRGKDDAGRHYCHVDPQFLELVE